MSMLYYSCNVSDLCDCCRFVNDVQLVTNSYSSLLAYDVIASNLAGLRGCSA